MVLSRGFRYATRLMIELARLRPEQRAQARTIAVAAGLPPAWNGKLVSQMVAAHLVDSRRGRRGGIRLSRPAGTILLADIAAAMVRDELDDCVLGFPTCDDRDACPAHRQWVAVRQSVREDLLQRTLASLVAEPRSVIDAIPAGHRPGAISDILL